MNSRVKEFIFKSNSYPPTPSILRHPSPFSTFWPLNGHQASKEPIQGALTFILTSSREWLRHLVSSQDKEQLISYWGLRSAFVNQSYLLRNIKSTETQSEIPLWNTYFPLPRLSPSHNSKWLQPRPGHVSFWHLMWQKWFQFTRYWNFERIHFPQLGVALEMWEMSFQSWSLDITFHGFTVHLDASM